MKRRTLIRNVAAGSLLVAGAGSASAVTSEAGSTTYKLERNGDTFELVETLDAGVLRMSTECRHDDPNCCADSCCDCGSDCDVCYCDEFCTE